MAGAYSSAYSSAYDIGAGGSTKFSWWAWQLFGANLGMFKNVASQKITVLAIDTATNLPKTGDAANITAYVSKDDGAVTVLGDTTATEIDSTNALGLYSFDLTQSETNADKLIFSAKSSTSGIRIVPQTIFTFPASFTSFVTPTGSAVNATQIGGQTASASGTITFPNATLASTTNITAAAGCAVSSIGTDVINSTALAASAVTEIWASVADSSGVTTLLSRLSSARAGYLDNLSAGAVAQASTFTGMTSLAQWLGALAGKQAPNSTALTEINATGAGSGTYSATTDALEASRDNIGTAGAGLTSADDAVISAITALNNITAASVWDLATSGHTTSGTFGAAMNAAGSAGDPWATSLPGAYGAGSAGYIVGNNADSSGVTTLLSRLSSARAGYLDNLNSGVPLATDALTSTSLAASAVTEIWASVADSAGVTTLLSRLSSARAGYLDNINNSALASVPAFPSNFSSLGINASGHVSRVTLADTTTMNTDMLTSAAVATAVLGSTIETGKTLTQCIRAIAAAAAGKRSNCGTTSEQYDAIGNAGTARIVVNADADGNGTPTLSL